MEQIDYDVDEFIDYCTSKNLSTKTIGSYEQTIVGSGSEIAVCSCFFIV